MVTECDETTGTRTQVAEIGRSGRSRILRVSSRTLTSSEVQPLADVVPDERNDVERQRCRERRLAQLLLDEPAHVAGAGAELAVPVHDVELVVQAGHAGAAQARRGLEGGDDEPGELADPVQHGERVDHRHDRGAGVRDDAARPVGDLARVHLGHDQRHVGLGAELGAVVDGDHAARRRQLDPLAGDRGRDVEDGDVDAVEELRRQRLDDDVLATDPQRRADVLDPGGQAHPAPVRVAGRQHVEHDPAHGAGHPHDAQGRQRAPRGPLPGGSHVSGRCPRRRRPLPRRSPARTPCAPPAPPRRGGRHG